MNKLLIPFLFIVYLMATSCGNDEPKDKTKDIMMSVSEEPGVMYDLFDDEGKYPMMCLRVMDEDFPGEWRNLALTAIEGFEYQIGHMYTIRVRRTILANPPADASAYTYKLLSIHEDRIWPPAEEPKDDITVNLEEDIPYDEGCPYPIYNLYRDGAFIVDSEGKWGYKDTAEVYDYRGLDDMVLRLEFSISKESPDFMSLNRWGKMAYFAYVISPLTDRIEKVRLDRGSLYLKNVISRQLYDDIVSRYESGATLEYGLVLANIHGYGLQKVSFSITKK